MTPLVAFSRGGLWSEDGETIFFSAFTALGAGTPSLFRVSARGGEASPLDVHSGPKGNGNTVPSLWSGREGKLVFEVGNFFAHDIVVKNLATKESTHLTEGAIAGYSPTGHILFQPSPLAGGLWALPFSRDQMRATGEAFPIVEEAGGASVSDGGTLTYLDSFGAGKGLQWFSREGRPLETLVAQDRAVYRPRLSPDGRFVAWDDNSLSTRGDVWVTDTLRGTSARLNAAPEESGSYAVWSPSGDVVAYRTRDSSGGGSRQVRVRPANGSRAAELLDGAQGANPEDWSPDGRTLLVNKNDAIWTLDLVDGTEPKQFLSGGYQHYSPQFSPDGKYVAYCSNETGERQVYVTSFPDRAVREIVSSEGGCQPCWSADGNQLYYVNDDFELLAVPVSMNPALSFGQAERLFRHPTLRGTGGRYDVHPDGDRFLLNAVEPTDGSQANTPSIHVVENWYEEFRDRE